MIIHINYANLKFYQSQIKCSNSALKFGCNKSINYKFEDIDSIFYADNKYILDNVRGAGYWLWKPYFILKTFNQINDNDIVFYTDSGLEFINDIDPLIQLTEKEDIILFEDGGKHKLKEYTKRDCFYYLNCDSELYYNQYELVASYQIYKKTEKSIKFLNDYLKLCEDKRLITDDKNVCGLPNLKEFKDHRHDQSILTLFGIKQGIKFHKDPSQFGLNDKEYKEDNYKQIINHTRNKL